jgi:hypothetical protein
MATATATVSTLAFSNDGARKRDRPRYLQRRLVVGSDGDPTATASWNALDLALFKQLFGAPPGPALQPCGWQNSTAGVTIARPDAPTTFKSGQCDFGAGNWTGNSNNNSDWAFLTLAQSARRAHERVIFNATDNLGFSRIDPPFGTPLPDWWTQIWGRHLQFDRSLQINGPVEIHTANGHNQDWLNIIWLLPTHSISRWNVGITPLVPEQPGSRLIPRRQCGRRCNGC